MNDQNARRMTSIATPSSTAVTRNQPTDRKRTALRKFRFTKDKIDALKAPTTGQRAYSYDTVIHGLAIAVSTLGKKTFLLYRKVHGRPERINIGPYPDVSIDQARRRADELNGKIAGGENPAAKRRSVRDEDTLEDLFLKYLERHAKKRKETKTWNDDQRMFQRQLNRWRYRKISDIRRADVEALHNHIGETSGKYVANRVVRLLSSMFNKAIDWEWDGKNPASRIEPFQEIKRDRYILEDEFPAFMAAILEESNKEARDYFLLSLFTAARRANVQEMKWSEINWPAASWTVPETKNGEPVTIPLVDAALLVLKSRRRDSASEWVLPGTGKLGHFVEPKAAWKRILGRAGITGLRIHDLRRTNATYQAITGSTELVIARSLGHKTHGVTQGYARLSLDSVRISMQTAVDAMMNAAGRPTLLLGAGE
jgi:integrase